LVDAVDHRGLEVRVGVNTEPVDGLDNGAVGAVHPVVPGIHVSDRDTAKSGAGKSRADLADVVDKILRLSSVSRLGSNAGGRETVEILTADGETDDTAGEIVTVLGDSILDRGKLVVDAVLASRRPNSKKESCVCGDGSRNSCDGIIGSSALLFLC
jgi:hypothetical protein